MAFEGGGAKGLLHVGALRTLEASGITYRGIAGTSAGAIVAALTAAGLKSTDLFSTEPRMTLIDRLGEIDPTLQTPKDFFGTEGWARIIKVRAALRHWRWLILGSTIVPISFAALFFAIGIGWWIAAGVAGAVLATIIFFSTVAIRRISRGLTRLDRFRNATARLLQQTMFPGQTDRMVVMKDFGEGSGRPSLKIVGANLETQSLHLFSPEETPNVLVADAIAASICLPIIFPPWIVDGARFVDGGIVSNLPAWPFDEERELFPNATTIAFQINGLPASPGGWLLSGFVLTALFGTARLSTRIFGRGISVDMPTTLGTLDFDLSWARASQEVADAERFARIQLDRQLIDLPSLFHDACVAIKELAADVVGESLEIPVKRVRVAVAVADDRYFRSFRLRYSAGFGNDQDAELLIPKEGTIFGTAVATKASVIEVKPFAAAHQLPGHHNARRRYMVWKARTWIIAIPIYGDETRNEVPQFIVQIDGNASLPDDAVAVQSVLDQVREAAEVFFAQVAAQLRDRVYEDDETGSAA